VDADRVHPGTAGDARRALPQRVRPFEGWRHTPAGAGKLDAVAVRLRHDFPHDDETVSFGTVPFVDVFVGDYRQRLLTLLAAVGLVLLIACATWRTCCSRAGAARARELSVRKPRSARPMRIVRQLLTESLMLALCAAGAGLLLARGLVATVVAWGPNNVPRLEQARIDPIALAFAVASRSSAASCAGWRRRYARRGTT